MTRDTVIFGALAGIVGNIPKTILTLTLYYLGYIENTHAHFASGYFVNSNLINQPVSLINGYICDFFYASFLGILIYLVLQKTGMDYALLKGFFIGGFIHVVNNGVLIFAGINENNLTSPLEGLLLIFPEIIFALTACWFIRKYCTSLPSPS